MDFKEGGSTAAIAECAAAMANLDGGLIFVGIADQDREIVAKPWRTSRRFDGWWQAGQRAGAPTGCRLCLNLYPQYGRGLGDPPCRRGRCQGATVGLEVSNSAVLAGAPPPDAVRRADQLLGEGLAGDAVA